LTSPSGRSQIVSLPELAILAHRGGAREAPENTLAAIEHARSAGADGVELDVRLSLDGEPVVFHDHDLRRLGSSRRRVDESGLHELVAIDLGRGRPRFAGETIPTLSRALEAARGLDPIQLELKAEGDAARLARRVVDEVARHELGTVIQLTSFSKAALDEVRRVAPGWTAGLILAEPPGDSSWLGFPIVSLSRELAAAGWAARANQIGVRVYVWTENDPASLASWSALGIAGLITDRPARLVEALRARRSTEH
jgi:glycerophosphoryl diester phosphodiesterase